MSIQYISTNKNYKRLYNAPIDPSLVWDNITELRNYLNDPTCYSNMIVGCNGKAYIVVEKNGVKDIKPIGTINSGGTVNSNLYVGSEEPTDDGIIAWIDTSEAEEGYTGNISDLIIDEFREIFKTMNEEIEKLKDRVLYLETYLNSGGVKPTGNIIVVYKDNTILVTEDGKIIVYFGNESVKPTTNNIIPVYGDNTTLVTENDEIIVY